jgi:hypothetical protein
MIANVLRLVPRAVVKTYARGARLPLTLAERIANQQGNASWPPSIAFEAAEAQVESLVGALVRDPALAESGRLRQARVAKLREAAELKTVATVEAEQAQRAEQKRKAEIADERKQTVKAAAERKQTVERDAVSQDRKVAAKAAKKSTAVRRQKADQDQAIDRRERADRAEVLDAEAKALALVKDALEAEEMTEVIDASIEGSKEARKLG